MCLVSVIIPTYNRAHLLDVSVKSVLNQTLKDFELIIIDDGSKDNTKDKVLSYGNSRMRYIYKSNGGLSSARNTGITNARGKYIAFLDDDDCWPANYLEKMVGALENNLQYGLAYCKTASVSDGKIIKNDDIKRFASGDVTSRIFQQSFIWPSASFIRRSALGDLRNDELLRNCEDSDFYLRLSVVTQYLYVEDITVHRNFTMNSLSQQIDCTRILVLKRFYYLLGGKDIIPSKIANKKLSSSYRQSANRYLSVKNYKAASYLFFKSRCFYPYDLKIYLKFLYSKILSIFYRSDWHMPEPLGMPMATNIVGQETIING